MVYDNRVLRRIFGSEVKEVTGDWRRLRNMEHRNLYSSQSIIRVIKSVTMWQGHVARMETRNSYRILVGNPERNYQEDYSTSQKVAGSRPYEVNCFSFCLIFTAALGPGVHSASNRNEYQAD
jgi:hypothetical protein